jgi:general secretion pathway protein J
LLELLVAMGIFGIIGAMALGGLNAVVDQSTQTQQQTDRLAGLQRAIRLIVSDLASVQPRMVRDELGSRNTKPDSEQGPLVSSRLDYDIRGSRGGWRNPAGLPFRGTLQRFQYKVDDGKLYRDYWPVMDHTLQQAEPRREELLSGVKGIKFWYYAGDASERFDRWPPLTLEAQAETRPKAIQVILELEDWGEIERWVEVPQ